ncbi:UNVERIFIED_CONTAM: hypothetical protein K2H54_017166 [Gekko kuhli]
MVHNARRKQLRFKLASGRAFYLRLCSPPDQREDLFDLWVKVVNMLYPPSEQRLETQAKIGEPGGRREDTAPAQRPESPNAINLSDTVSIRTVYSFTRAPSLTQEDTRSRQSPSISWRSQHSTEDPVLSPVLTQEKAPEPDISPASDDTGPEESSERQPSHQDLSPDEEAEYKSSPPLSSFSPEAQQNPLPHHILLLGQREEWEAGVQGQGQREETLKEDSAPKGKAKGKKH